MEHPGNRAPALPARAALVVLAVVAAMLSTVPSARAQTTPKLTITPGPAVAEGTAAAFTITASSAPASNLTVNLWVSDASGGGDFVASGNEGAKTATIASGQTSVTYSVPTVGDSVKESSGSVQVLLKTGTGYSFEGYPRDRAGVVVKDDDGPPTVAVTLSGDSAAIAEAGGAKTLTVALDADLADGVKVWAPLFLGYSTATAGVDFTLAGTAATGVSYQRLDTVRPYVVFTGGTGASRTATITLTATQDSIDEGDAESVQVEYLSGEAFISTAATLTVATGHIVGFDITDDDAAPTTGSASNPVVSVASGSKVTEGSAATFTVTVAPAPSSNLTVSYNVSEGRGDYVASGDEGDKTVAISSGSTSATVTVNTAADSTDEPDGSVTLTLGTGTGYQVASSPNHAATVSVDDDDATTVVLSAASGDIQEGQAKEVTATLGRALDAVAGESATVPLDLRGGAAGCGADYEIKALPVRQAHFTLTEGCGTNAEIRLRGGFGDDRVAKFLVRAKPDSVAEGTGETVTIAWDSANTSSSALGGGITPSGTATFKITEAARPTVSVAAVAVVDEQSYEGPNAKASFRVTVDAAPAAALTVRLAISQKGQFVAAADLGSGKTVVIPAGSTSAVYEVALVDDNVDELDGAVVATIEAHSAYTVGSRNSAERVVQDDEITTVTLSLDTAAIAETGGAKQVTVSLSRKLLAGERIQHEMTHAGTATCGTDYAFKPPSPDPPGLDVQYLGCNHSFMVTFDGNDDPSMTSQSVTFTLEATSDSIGEGAHETVIINHKKPGARLVSGVNSGGPRRTVVQGQPQRRVNLEALGGPFTFNITDDDTTTTTTLPTTLPVVSVSGGSAVNEGAAASFTVSASPAPSASLTVRLTVSQSGSFVAPGLLGAKTVTIAGGQASAVHTVATQDDNTDEPDGSVTVVLASGSGYTVAASPNHRASVTVRDDDAPIRTPRSPTPRVGPRGPSSTVPPATTTTVAPQRFARLVANADGVAEYMPKHSACTGAARRSAGFDDVTGPALQAAVDCLAYYGITLGTSAGEYSPDRVVTRAQMALFLVRAAAVAGVELPAPGDAGFTDLGGELPAVRRAVSRLAQLGVARGVTPEEFSPRSPVTRLQMALFLYRLFKLAPNGPDGFNVGIVFSSEGSFEDLPAGDEPARAVRALFETGVTNGTSAGRFDPDAPVTRAQMALFLTRILALTKAAPPRQMRRRPGGSAEPHSDLRRRAP